MPTPLTSSSFVRLLDKRLRMVGEARYAELESMIPMFFSMLPSDSAWEEFFDVGAVPSIPEFLGKITYLPVAPGFYTRIEPKEYAGGLQHERKLIDDKKYAVLDNRSRGLAEAAHRTREETGVELLAYAFSTAFAFMYSEEGKALCSTTHLTKATGVSTTNGFSNAGTSAFSKTAVAATRLAMRKWKNDVGARIGVGDDLELWVPDALAEDAYTIVRTPQGYQTAAMDDNFHYGRYEVYPYLRLDDYSETDWFMCWKSQRKKSAIWIERIAPEIKTTVDFNTYVTLTAVYMRFAYGFWDWRWIYGHNVS